MTKAQELGITEFPYYEYNENGNKTYYEDSEGHWVKWKFDSNGNKTYYEDSDGFWTKREFDSNNNQTYYENSRCKIRGVSKSKQYSKNDLLTIMNLGMELRQNQLNGSDSRSGKEVLDDWISENKK